MIVRKDRDGAMILIAQTDHSRLVGEFAAHWGNERFATPRPYEAMARAAAFHDYGWLPYETAPLYDGATGETPQFYRAPATARQLDSYQWCIDGLLAADPYASLIVSMHRTGLWRGRYDTVRHPTHAVPPSLAPPVAEFIERNEARQARERAPFDAAEIWTNYHLLQVWDQLGLYFSCQDPYEEYIDPVPTSYGGDRADGVRMAMTPTVAREVRFEPYPFDARPLHVQLLRRRLPSSRYPDQAAFRQAYFQAPLELIDFALV